MPSELTEVCTSGLYSEGVPFSLHYGILSGGRADRLEDLYSLMHIAIASATGSSSFSPTDEFNEAATAYTTSIVPYFAVPTVLAALLALMWPCLWISRCCAHRCCKPKYGYSTSDKRWAFCGYLTCWVLVFACIVLACLSGAEGAHEMRRAACAVNEAAANVSTLMETTVTAVGATASSVGGLAGGLSSALGNVSALAAQLDGPLVSACGAIVGAEQATNAIAASVPPGGSPPAAFDAARAMMSTARGAACDLSALSGSVGSARDALSAFRGTADAFGASAAAAEDAVRSIQTSFGSADAELSTAIYPILWEGVGVAIDVSGVALAALALALLVLACPGAWCLCQRHSVRACSLNQCGVQCTGCAWVLSSLVAVIYLLLSACLLPAAAGLADATAALQLLPTSPELVLGASACNLSTSAGSVNLCAALAACDSTSGQNLTQVLLGQLAGGGGGFDVSYATAQEGALSTRLSEVQSQVDAMSASQTNLQAAQGDLGGISAADFGAPDGSAAHDEITTQLGYVSANLSIAIGVVGPAVTTAQTLVRSLAGVQQSVSRLVSSLTALMGAGSCTFFPSMWRQILAPCQRVFERGLGGLGIAMGLIGITLAASIVPAIIMQIRLGEVGREPGCPARCRCCCGKVVPRGAKRAIKVDGAEVTADAGNELVGV